MKIEFTREGLLLLMVVVMSVCTTTGYYIYRETNIRQTLVERARDESYGTGILNQIDIQAERMKVHSTSRKK